MSIFIQIKQLFKNKSLNTNSIKKILKENLEIQKSIKKEFEKENKKLYDNSLFKYIICVVKDLKPIPCQHCGNFLTYKQFGYGRMFCSQKCAKSDKQTIQQRRLTCQKKYNVDNVNQLTWVRNKIESTCLQRYNYKNVFQNQQIKRKIENTNLIKYNVKNPRQNLQINQKIKNTCLEKYGSNNPFGNKNIKQKIKETNIEKYGVPFVMQNKEILQKTQNTNLKRYNTKYSCQSEKAIQYRIDKVWNRILTWKDYLIPLFSKEEYNGQQFNKIYRWKCTKCGNEFFSKVHGNNSIDIEDTCIPKCYNCYPISHNESILELELFDFCKEYFRASIHHCIELIKPFEIDIFIPEIKLGLQFNGLYWHSIDKKEKGYHLKKTELCQNLGIRLIHIWQDQWIKNKEEIKRKLIDIFENKEKINIENKLDRCWYMKKELNQFNLIIEEPKIIVKENFKIENCGYLIYERI